MGKTIVERRQFKTYGKTVRAMNNVNAYCGRYMYHDGIMYAEFKHKQKNCSTYFFCTIYPDYIDAVMVEYNVDRSAIRYKGFNKLLGNLLLIGDYDE